MFRPSSSEINFVINPAISSSFAEGVRSVVRPTILDRNADDGMMVMASLPLAEIEQRISSLVMLSS
jgi:hypothetical protein